MTTNTAAAPVRTGRVRSITLWTVQVALAAFYVFASIPKLTGDPMVVEMMAHIGFAPWVGYFIGAAELAGAIGLLIPRLTGLAATGLALLMVGATITNIAIAGPGAAAMTLVLAGVFSWIAWARRSSIKSLLKR